MSVLRRGLMACGVVLIHSLAAGQIISNFNTSADGWTATAGTFSYSATGGNPGGFVTSSDPFTAGPPPIWYFSAPPKFLGNRCPSYGMPLKFDLSQGTNGADSAHPDVVIVGGGLTLNYVVTPGPSYPTVYPLWRSYNVILSETAGWIVSTNGAAATKDQFKSVLCNLTALYIRGEFSPGTISYGALDNVSMGELTVGARPVITSIAPTKGIPGSSVTIAGSNFNATTANNIVYFGPTRATVTAASTSQLTVNVPAGAVFGRVTVLNTATKLEGQSSQNFNPIFDNNLDYGGRLIPCSMDLKFTINLDASALKSAANVADLDGDGRTDLVAIENGFQRFSVFRNLGLTGDINGGSFAPKVSFAIGYPSKGGNAIADFDGDGKPDVAVACASTANAFVALFRNISTPGTIAFAPVQYIIASGFSDGFLHAADIDGDGRMELLSTWNSSCGAVTTYFSIFQNMSVPGDIEFCSFVDFDFGILCQSNAITTGDLNADGKLDIAVNSNFDNLFYVFQNTSTPGTFTLATPFAIDSPGLSYSVSMVDLDADDKLDLVWKADSPNEIYIRKNIYTTGPLSAASFSADVVFPTPMGSAGALTVADINGDGKPDLVANDDTNLGILQNVSTAGALTASSFIAGVLYEGGPGTSLPTIPVIADFDGDGKPDVAFGSAGTTPSMISIFRNESFPAPVITSVSPLTASIGTDITFTGSLMATGNQTPSVQFGAVAGTTGTATNASVTAVNPFGSSYDRPGVKLHGLTAFSPLPFSITFATVALSDQTFSKRIDFPMVNNSGAMAVADFDHDGKIDVIAEDAAALKIFHNTLPYTGADIDASTYTTLATTYPNATQVAGGDFDGDGLIDVVINGFVKHSNSGSLPDPISFESNINFVASNANHFVTDHDYNHDGKMDIAYTENGDIVHVTENTSRKGPFTNLPFATFQAPITIIPGGPVLGIEAADLDGDGFDDLAYVLSSGSSINVHLNSQLKGTITAGQFANAFPVSVGKSPYDVIAADLDQDGKMDLIIANFSSPAVTILRNTSTTGKLNFDRQDVPAPGFGLSVRAADLNGDGKPELVSIHAPTATTGSFAVFPNTSTSGTISFGTRIDYALSNAPAGLALADVNLDRKIDILIVRNGDFLSVFQNGLVIPQPLVTLQPTDAVVCAGGRARFEIEATGITGMMYQWQVGKTIQGPFADIDDSANYSGATDSVLQVNTAGNFGQGWYRCIVGSTATNFVSSNAVTLSFDLSPSCATNKPPVIAPATEMTGIGGTISVDLIPLLSDPDNNLDLSTLTIIARPASGAVATLNANQTLTIDYAGLSFIGGETITVEVCDLSGACTQKDIDLRVGSSVVVYNGISINGDGKNERFFLEFIDILATTKNNRVTIYNRWGDEVFAVNNYDNLTRVFTGMSSDGKLLPTGTYFYRIVFTSGARTMTGYLELKR